MRVDEGDDLRPRIVGRGGELFLLAVEEAVRCAFVRDELVVRRGRVERGLESGVVLGGDVLVGPGLERENRRLQLGGALRRVRRPAIEAHGSRKPSLIRRREPRLPAAETEADGEDPMRSPLAEVCDAGGDVCLHRGSRRLLDVRHVLEAVVTLRCPRGAPEVVEGDGGHAALRKPQRELLVEAIQAADVREDDDADLRRLCRSRGESGEPVAVVRLQRQILVRDGRAADDRDRR